MSATEIYDELSVTEGWVVFSLFIPKRPFKIIRVAIREAARELRK